VTSITVLGLRGTSLLQKFPHYNREEQIANIQETSFVGDMARSIPKINVALDDHQVEYQPTMIEFEGKMHNHDVSILIDPGMSLSYISPKIIEICHL